MTLSMAPSWITCQIGARENYSLARALHAQGALTRLVTDLWCPPHWPEGLRARLGRVGERSHPDLPAPYAWAPMGAALLREAGDKLARRTGWDQILHRNAWFQRRAAAYLAQLPATDPMTVFAYSYAAGDILRTAQDRGWKTILGQIDPGPVEARMVTQLYRDAGQAAQRQTIPDTYWDLWRRETELADLILVNSRWSAEGLQAEGVPAQKIRILPLAYEGGRPAGAARPAVTAFNTERPLRLLFLGQVTLRKGADLVLEAMRLCPDLPIELDIVGPLQIALPDWVAGDPRIRLHGSVPRSRVGDFYAQADLFLFPTRSDGFGLTQLEALSAGVPILASRHCGEVVRPGTDGILLDELNAPAVASTLTGLLQDPDRVSHLQLGAWNAPAFGLARLGQGLKALEAELHGAGSVP